MVPLKLHRRIRHVFMSQGSYIAASRPRSSGFLLQHSLLHSQTARVAHIQRPSTPRGSSIPFNPRMLIPMNKTEGERIKIYIDLGCFIHRDRAMYEVLKSSDEGVFLDVFE